MGACVSNQVAVEQAAVERDVVEQAAVDNKTAVDNAVQPIRPSEEIALLADATYENTPEPTYDFTVAKVIRVYDGDTFWVAVKYAGKRSRFKVRLYGVDCPEIKGGTEKTKLAAQKAKKYVADRILRKFVAIEVLNNKIINGKKIQEKYGRLLSKIYVDGCDLALELIDRGLAKPYFGGTKE